MDMPVNDGICALTEKEKQTLRLIVRGHDAKSVARNLGLSVHTINERLRDARRKMAVSNSREAARILLHAEGGLDLPSAPQSVGDDRIGEDPAPAQVDQDGAPTGGAGPAQRRPWIIIKAIVMTLLLGLLALVASPHTVPLATSGVALATPDAEVVDTARQWLTLLDQGKWDESYRQTGASFRGLNTAEIWAKASEKARVPQGAMISRTFVSQENLPAPPAGYEVVKFRTRFANTGETIETVSLNRENGGWHVVGVTIG